MPVDDIGAVASPYLTIKEAKPYARVGEKFLYAACRRRQLRHIVLSRGKLLTTRPWLDEWLARSIREVAPR